MYKIKKQRDIKKVVDFVNFGGQKSGDQKSGY